MMTVAVITMFLSFGVLGTAPVAAQQRQGGLVNVAIGDITTGDILSNDTVNVAVAANIAAEVCGVTVPVSVLAQQLFRTGGFSCSSGDQFVDVTQRR